MFLSIVMVVFNPHKLHIQQEKKIKAAFADRFFGDSDSDSAGGAFIPQAWEKDRRICQELQYDI